MKVVYLGVFLTPTSRKRLLRMLPPKHSTVHADHVTVILRPTEEEVRKFPLGKRVVLKVVAHSFDDLCEAVVVRGIGSNNPQPHITLSTTAETAPAYSNKMLQNTRPEEQGTLLRLEGYCDTFPRTEVGTLASLTRKLRETFEWLKNARGN